MTLHRFVYKLCLKNHIIFPLLLLLAAAGMVVQLLSSGPGGTLEMTQDGRVLIRYKHAHQLLARRDFRTPGPPEAPAGKVDSQRKIYGMPDDGEKPVHHLEIPKEEEEGGEEVELERRGQVVNIKPDDLEKVSLDKLQAKYGLSNVQMERLLKQNHHKVHRAAGELQQPGGDTKRKRVSDIRQSVVVEMRPRNRTWLPGPEGKQDEARNEGQEQAKEKHKGHLHDKHKHRHQKQPLVAHWATKLYYNVSNPPQLFQQYNRGTEKYCGGKFEGYVREFAVLQNVVLDMDYCVTQRKGGEKIAAVFNQSEDVEYLSYDMGCFQLNCDKRPTYNFNTDKHLNDWMYSLKMHNVDIEKVDNVVKDFTLAIVRYEYANIYHTMTDWYNAFLVMQYFNKTPSETKVVLFDAHPRGSLDAVWPVLFRNVSRISYFPKRTLFTNMVWSIIGYNSPMIDFYGPQIPLTAEFREFFLSSYNIPLNHQLDCDRLTVLFLWRRDYIAHPRNPSGEITRKIQNEREILQAVQKTFPGYRVRGVQLDIFDMEQQLRFIAAADILIGMHGAGMTHTFFLPKHAGLIELVPSYWSSSNDHFYAIAQWRDLVYERWINEDPRNEALNYFTKIPPSVVKILVKNMARKICNRTEATSSADRLPP